MCLRASLLVLALFFSEKGYSQSYAVELYGVEIGLPSYFTKAIAQTPDRVLWVASDNGLVQFNSRDVTVFQRELLSPYVKNVHFLDGISYVITDGGIQRLVTQGGTTAFETVAQASVTLSSGAVYFPKSLYKDRRNRFWVVEPNGVSRLDGGAIRRYLLDPKYIGTDTYVATLFPAESGDELYIFSQTGYVLRFDEEKDDFIEVSFTGSGLRPIVRGITRRSETSWIAGGENGLVTLERIEENRFSWQYENKALNVTAVTSNAEGRIFIATKNEGVFNWLPGLTKPVLVAQLPNYGLNNLFVDRDQNVWASCDQGFALIQPKLFQHVIYPQAYQFTNQLAVGPDGTAWVVSESALFSIRTDVTSTPLVATVRSDAPAKYLSIYAGREKLAVGSSKGMLMEREPGGRWAETAIPQRDVLRQAHAYYITDGPDGSLWFLMYNLDGVFRKFPNGNIRHYEAADSLSIRLNCIAFAPDGTLFAGGNGRDEYLFRYNAAVGRFENLSFPIPGRREPIVNIHDLSFDATGNLWIVGNEGLLRLEGSKIIRAEGQQDLRYELFSALAVASNNDIWIGAQNGVYLYRNGVFTQFSNRDGLPSLTVNYRCLRIDRFDRVWVGTINGLAFLERPFGSLEPTATPTLTSLRVNGVQRPITGTAIDIPEMATLEMQFLAIGFPAAKMEYQTRMVGLEENWRVLQSSDRIFYQQLKPGTYRFEVRAQRRGYPAGLELVVPVQISRFWYNTWQARLGYLFAFVLIIFAGLRYQQKSRAQKQAEAKLRSTEQQLHTVFQSTPMIMFALDRQGLVFIAEGKGFELAGLNPSTLIGRPVIDVIKDAAMEMHISRVLAGAVVQCEITLNDRTFQLRMVPLSGFSEGQGGVLAVGDDLTERIEMERQLITAREEYREAKTVAEQANQAKSMFLASMSHELRTPMNAILGFAQILARDEDISLKNREYVQILQRSGEHLLSMINDVLDLSKIEAGRMEITEKLLDFTTLIQELKSMFELMAREKKLSFEFVHEPGIPRFLEADEGKVRQILINLIGNAIKYTQKGGIRIAMRMQQSDMLEISVKDTGRGIPADQLVSIFEPFRQVRGYNNKGTGLGLAISYRLAHLMKGRLEVTSEQGVGSDFRLYLPVKLSHQDLRLDTETEYDVPVKGIAGEKTFTVHVVDDVYENRALLRALLEPLGFVCIEAENGLQALERLEEKLPDLILMDIVMPEMDGREAVRIIRTRPDCKDLPIVAITASGFEDERKALLSLGFTAYLRKPFIDRDLYEIIARMLNITWVFAKDAETGNGLDSQIDIMEYVAKTISKAEDNPALATLREAIETVDLNQLIDVLQHIQLPEPILNRLLKEAKAANFRFFMDLQERIDEGA